MTEEARYWSKEATTEIKASKGHQFIKRCRQLVEVLATKCSVVGNNFVFNVECFFNLRFLLSQAFLIGVEDAQLISWHHSHEVH